MSNDWVTVSWIEAANAFLDGKFEVEARHEAEFTWRDTSGAFCASGFTYRIREKVRGVTIKRPSDAYEEHAHYIKLEYDSKEIRDEQLEVIKQAIAEAQKAIGASAEGGGGQPAPSFETVTRPVIEWLNENCHPHVTVIITQTRAEQCEGQRAYVTFDFVKD